MAKKAKKKSAAKKRPSARKKAVRAKSGGKKKKAAPKKAVKKRKTRAKKAPSKEALFKPGDAAPAFQALNEKGEAVSLDSLRGKKVVLYFYPKDDTPGCTQEGCDFRDSFARIRGLGAEVFGISRDSIASHVKFREKHGFPFSLLADEDGKLCEVFGVWRPKSLYGRKYMGIERTTFLIDEEGRIVRVYPNVKVKGHVDQVLEDLKA